MMPTIDSQNKTASADLSMVLGFMIDLRMSG